MTLQDFFTLTEMKDGLTAPARVKELINVMQKNKHNIVKSVGDATRQWSTVASTIAATENSDCLTLFLQLDGLCYFNTWLKDGQKCFQEIGDVFIEESMTVLLGAIEKLHIDGQKLVTSGIMMTVKDLLSNKSSRVQDRARALYDSWKQNSDSNVADKDVEKDEALCDDLVDVNRNPASEHEQPECSSQDISKSRCINSEERNVEPATNEMTPAICPETMQPEGVVGLTIRPSDKTSDHASMRDGSPDPVHSSGTLKLVSEKSSVLGNPPTHQAEATTGIESSGSAVPEQRTLEGELNVANSKEHDDAKQMPQIRSCNNLGTAEDVDVEKKDPCPKIFCSGDVRKEVSEGIGEMCDSISANPCSIISASGSTALVDEYNVNVLRDSSVSEHNMGKNEDLNTNISRKEDTEALEESNDQNDTDEDEVDLGNDYDISMSGVDVKDSVKKTSDFEHDYDMFDPLEVARQVAIDVEREVDFREPSSSSSERTSGGGIRLPESPDSIKGKNSRVIHRSLKGVSTGPNLFAVVGEMAFVKAKNLPSKTENCMIDIKPTGVSEVAQKAEPDEDKRLCGFDLNEEVLSDDMDHKINPVTAPISVVSASRAAATSGLPLSPLQFEGTLGWKGSAETSAFRPAPMHKVSEGENSFFASGSSGNLFRRQDYLEFDLNVAGNEDDKITELPLSKEIPNSTGQPSGNCSLEASPKRSDLLQLDLNCVSDSGDAPLSHWRKEARVLPHWNGQFSPSASSSSSSMQPSLKNFDLNDQPSHFTEFLDPALNGKSSSNICTSGSGGFKTDESVISLMGARVEVNRKDNVPQTVPFLNGSIVDPALYARMTRNDSDLGLASSSLYAHSSLYGYNGPSYGHIVPASSSIYGLGDQIPYMVDSRGTPVVPQVLGSVPAFPPSFSQPSFIMSLAAAPSDSHGFVPSRHGFDLNSGLMIEGGSRDVLSTRQLFNPGQGILIDEQMRANSQSTSSSGSRGKRKEADGGWDPYPFNYKHPRPPWQ